MRYEGRSVMGSRKIVFFLRETKEDTIFFLPLNAAVLGD